MRTALPGPPSAREAPTLTPRRSTSLLGKHVSSERDALRMLLAPPSPLPAPLLKSTLRYAHLPVIRFAFWQRTSRRPHLRAGKGHAPFR